jgi:hypothetical protein
LTRLTALSLNGKKDLQVPNGAAIDYSCGDRGGMLYSDRTQVAAFQGALKRA